MIAIDGCNYTGDYQNICKQMHLWYCFSQFKINRCVGKKYRSSIEQVFINKDMFDIGDKNYTVNILWLTVSNYFKTFLSLAGFGVAFKSYIGK